MKMPVETMTSSPLSRFLHLDKLKAGLLSSDTVQLSDGGPNTPELVPLTKENCPTIRDPQKTHPAELDAAVIPPSTTVPTSHKAPIPGPYYSSQHNGPSPSRQPGSTQSTEEVSLSLNQTIQGHSSAPSKELPGNKPKKAFFFMPVSSHNWSVEDYAKRFDYVSKQLMGAVSKNSNLRCRSQHIIYKSVMIGVSEDTAVPCVLIQCRKKEYKDLLKLIGDLDTGLIGCYMCSNSIFSRTFRSQRLSNDPPFEIIIEAHARGPLRRRAGEIATISLTSETVCGASVRYQDRIATISLVLSIDGIYRLVTVDHLFNPGLDSEELTESTDDENSYVDSSTQGLAVDQKGGRDEKFDSEMTQAETVSMNPAIVSLDHTSAPHSPEASNVLALHGGIATHVVKPPFALHSSAPYLDWTVLEFVWNSGLPLLNMIYLNDSKSPTVLRYVAESPKSHGTPVFMISGTGKLKEGNLLTGVTYLGPRGGCDPCEVWTMLLESSKGLMPGESGSLVVDRETFAVYGHVVGTDILDNVYVVPLTQTIRQIESTFHAATVCLPDLAQSSKRAASPPMYSDGMKPQYGITEVKKRRGRAAPPGRCQSCNRINTTEWRRGPDGARTLCNACGLHYAKVERKRQLEARSIRPKPEAAPTDNEIPVKNRKIEHPEVSELIQRANENADVEKELDSTDSDMSVSDDNGANGIGIGSGNDQDERRKPVALYTESGLSLACPFAKRYPGEKQPRCDRGWPTVHRVKQHIYRAHRQPIHCERCFQTFESVEDLGFHLCTIVDRPLEIPGVDSETIERLKSRKGLNKLHEIEKWKRVYEILFPDAKDIPPPYYNLPTIETAVTAEVRAQCRREVAPRAIRAISDTLRNMPGFQFNPKLSEQQFFEMISASVWNAFDAVLPNSPPQTVSGNVVPGDMKAQQTTDRVLGQLSPAPSSVPQPTGLSKLDQASSTSNNTNNQELIHILNGQTRDPFGSGDSGYYTAHGSNFAF